VILFICYNLQRYAAIAQLVERIHGKDEVSGSIPDRGSIFMRMNDIKLIAPDLAHEKAVMKYRYEPWEEEHAHIPGGSSLGSYDDFDEWLRKVDLTRHKETTPEGLVSADLYIAYRESDDKVVGMIQIRHELNEYLYNFGGHIGYSVAPSERRKGYATAMLEQALDKCRDLRLDKVLLTCDTNNVASASVIEKCGGVLENESTDPEGKTMKRYWITL